MYVLGVCLIINGNGNYPVNMHAATACQMSIKIISAIKIKTKPTEHASYLINKAFIVLINYL